MSRRMKIITPKNGARSYVRAEMTNYMRKKMGRIFALRREAPDFQKKMQEALNKKPNKLEKDFYDELKQCIPNLLYVGNYGFFVRSKNPDFILYDKDISKCIELFGDYWHKGEDPNVKIKYYKSQGYDLLVIWEHEWKERRSKVVNKVKDWASQGRRAQ